MLLFLLRDTQKQVHQGWGSDEGKAEFKAEVEGSKDAATETPVAASGDWGEGTGGDDAWGTPAPASGDASAQEGAATPGERRRQEEEEDNTLTLEEYLKQQKEKLSTVVPKLGEDNVRKANEGEDVFEGAVLHAKDEEDAYFAGKVKSCSIYNNSKSSITLHYRQGTRRSSARRPTR